MRPFRIATFNVWHGLAGRGAYLGLFGFREFESREDREARWRLALRELLEVDADILLLQELNPVSQRGQDLVSALGGQFYGRVDQSGLKVLSRGVPGNLSTGLGILMRGEARAARLREDVEKFPRSRKLSGRLGVTGEDFSLHFDEQRYAQFLSVRHERLGRILVVNTHLHHGFERFPELLKLLSAAIEAGKVTRAEVQDLLVHLDRSRDRRIAEVDRILELVERVSSEHDGVVIGGDLNTVATGGAIRSLELAGFCDLASKVGNTEATWDPVKNEINHRLQRVKGFDFPLPDYGNRGLRDVYRQFDLLPRRIDYLFARGSATNVSHVAVFGQPKPGESGASDHFGVVATWN